MSITDCKEWLRYSGWIVVWLLSFPTVAPAQQIAVGGYPLATAYGGPNGYNTPQN
jgi:hypothetical protein